MHEVVQAILGVQGIEAFPLKLPISTTRWSSWTFQVSHAVRLAEPMEDLVDLRVVDDAADVAALLVHHFFDERAEDRPRVRTGEADRISLLRLPDVVLRLGGRERLAVLGAKPGA